MDQTDAVLRGYTAMASAGRAQAYEAILPDALYAPVRDLFPTAPARMLDVGAGTGRDAAWLAAQDHRVVALGPVAAFRDLAAIRRCEAETIQPGNRAAGIRWTWLVLDAA